MYVLSKHIFKQMNFLKDYEVQQATLHKKISLVDVKAITATVRHLFATFVSQVMFMLVKKHN